LAFREVIFFIELDRSLFRLGVSGVLCSKKLGLTPQRNKEREPGVLLHKERKKWVAKAKLVTPYIFEVLTSSFRIKTLLSRKKKQ